jgi:uridine kinase
MPVPNTLTRVISKTGEVVPFSISKVHNAIARAIIDVENASSWESKERALKYAELVKDRIYRNFYDLNHLVKYFSKVLLTFDDTERERRVRSDTFAPRIAALLYLNYKEKFEDLTCLADEHRAPLLEMVREYFRPHIFSDSILEVVVDAFADKIFSQFGDGMSESDHYPNREFIQDMIEEVLRDIGETFICEGFMVFREGKRKIKTGEITEAQFTHDGIHRDRVRKTLLWNISNECDSVFELNDWVTGKDGKDFKELMRRADQRFYDDISEVVKSIVARADQLKVVIIAGPSCSNKTTTTAIIEKELEKSGLALKQLNVDDYFFDLAEHPKDEFGDYDFEMPEAIDMALLNRNLADLVAGREVQKPRYNFKTGKRDGYTPYSVGKNEIILIDCLHGLYKKLTEAVPTEKKFRIFTESANMVRSVDGTYTKWTDVRLLKRMIRDSLYRNYDPTRTLAHWAYVRKGELKHIIPYIYAVDAVLNPALPYELPILKAVLTNKLPGFDYVNKLRLEGRLDPYIRGARLNTLFDTIIPYENIDDVSEWSPIREFIGGSAYELAHNE